MPVNNLNTSISYLKGVGPNRADLLKSELEIFTFGDLVNFFPNRYIDRTQFLKIKDLQENSSEVQVIGKPEEIRTATITQEEFIKNITTERLCLNYYEKKV